MVPPPELLTLVSAPGLRGLTDAELERLLRLAGFEAAARDCRRWRAASELADELHDRQRYPPTTEAAPARNTSTARPRR
jgi:hypothetical protein